MDTNSDFRKTSVCQRIEEISKQEGISINALAAKIGVNQSTIATAIARDKGVNFDILYRIIKAFPHLSAEWLITGEGAIHKSEQTNAIPPAEYSDEMLSLLREQLQTKDTQINNLIKIVDDLLSQKR